MANRKLNSRGSVSSRGSLLYDRDADAFWADAPRESSLPGMEPEYAVLNMDMMTWPGPNADSAEPGVGGWYVESDDAGGDAAESVDVRDGVVGGVLRIQSNDADNDDTCVRSNGSPYKYVSGKRMWYYVELAAEDANDGELIFGLIPEDANADPIENEPADGIYFYKDETATEFDFRCKKNSNDSGGDLTTDTLSDDVSIHVGFKVLADGSLKVYSGSSAIGMSEKLSIAAGAAGLPDDEFLQIVMGVQTGSTATRYVDVKRLYVAQER